MSACRSLPEPDADPLVERILPPGKRVGVLTVSAASLTPSTSPPAPIPTRPPHGSDAVTRVMLDENTPTLRRPSATSDAGEALVAQHPDIGAVVLECTT